MILKHGTQFYICYVAFCRLFDVGSYIDYERGFYGV